MMAIYRCFFFVVIHSFIMWGMVCLGSLLHLHVYLGGFWVFLSICSLRRSESVFSVLQLGLLYDALTIESYFGVHAGLLAASTLIFDARTLKNIGFCRIRLYSFIFNLFFHFIYLMGQLFIHEIAFKRIIYYVPSMISLGGLIAYLSPLWIKLHQRCFL